MIRKSQATTLEAVTKIVNSVQHPNTAYIWLGNTKKEALDAVDKVLEHCKVCCKQLTYNTREHTLYFDNGSEIRFKAANDPSHLCGFRIHGIVTSTVIDDMALTAAWTCLTQTQGWVILINDICTDGKRTLD